MYDAMTDELPEWLRKAAKLRTREEIRSMAFGDPDLEPIRDFVKTL